jgi:hypothetical protein
MVEVDQTVYCLVFSFSNTEHYSASIEKALFINQLLLWKEQLSESSAQEIMQKWPLMIFAHLA